MRDTPNIAAEKTTPPWLDPDPIRACPAPSHGEVNQLTPVDPEVELAPEVENGVLEAVPALVARSNVPRCNRPSARTGKTQAAKSSAEAKNEKESTKLAPIVRNPELRRKRLKFAEAMREIGLDEANLAEAWFQLIARLTCNKNEEAARIPNEKLLFDLLKECVRMLEGSKSVADDAATGQPTVVYLSHNIPRPVRDDDGEKDVGEL
jgi:hypothetical protein